VLEDAVTAYAWFNIAAFNGNANAKKAKGAPAKEMTAEQIAEAQKLSREMLKKNPKLAKLWVGRFFADTDFTGSHG
jgi:hypothetical protein